MHDYSLGEVESLVKKSLVGAGYDWGVAEEGAKSVSLLCGYGFRGCELLLGILAHGVSRSALVVGDCSIVSSGALLCPIDVGVALSDMGSLIESSEWRVGGLRCPLLALPSLLRLAIFRERIYFLRWQGCEAYVSPSGFSVVGDESILESDFLSVCEVSQFAGKVHKTVGDSYCLSEAELKTLHKYFMFTTVPNSDASRLGGAGAGLSDND